MAFAVVGILGHFSKTLLLFFLPQIVNFLYSTPQLFGLLPCPRHRLPRLQEKTGLLEPSWSVLSGREGKVARGLLEVLAAVGLVAVRRVGEPIAAAGGGCEASGARGAIAAHSNLTILNLILVLRGPMREDRLTMELLGVQTLGSVLAFGVRYGGAGWFYDGGRR